MSVWKYKQQQYFVLKWLTEAVRSGCFYQHKYIYRIMFQSRFAWTRLRYFLLVWRNRTLWMPPVWLSTQPTWTALQEKMLNRCSWKRRPSKDYLDLANVKWVLSRCVTFISVRNLRLNGFQQGGIVGKGKPV